MRTLLLVLLGAAVLLLVGGDAQADRRRKAPLSFESWVFWFHANQEWLDPPRTLPEGLDARVEADLLPTVLWATDFANAGHSATQGAAHIALGKLARDKTHVERLLEGLSKTPSRFQAWEAATLGLGLLRRSDPARRFNDGTLDGARTRLLDVIEDDDYPVRTRGLAALSIGLLGDQPTAAGRAEVTTARLFALLRRPQANPDLPIGLLMAVGAQAPGTVTAAQREALRVALDEGRLFEQEIPNSVRAFVAHALGRVGQADDAPLLREITCRKRVEERQVRRSCAVALGTLAARSDAATRRRIAKDLREILRSSRTRDVTTRCLATISFARAVAADLEAGPSDLTARSISWLIERSGSRGKYHERPYAALGLSLIARTARGTAHEVPTRSLEKLYSALRAGLHAKKADARSRAGFAVALGIAGERGSIGDLRDLVRDVRANRTLRGYAAWALGALGADDEASVRALRAALVERSSDELRIMTTIALGFVGRTEPVRELLFQELVTARTQAMKGQAAAALARMGTPDAAARLSAIVRSESEQDLTRMMAVAGLGRLGEPEPLPSLGRLTSHTNYRLQTELLNVLFSVL